MYTHTNTQMLLRMAEITKLEDHIKCQRRVDSVKEEKIGLLTVRVCMCVCMYACM